MENPVAAFAERYAHVAAVEVVRGTGELVFHVHALVELEFCVEQLAVLGVYLTEASAARRVFLVGGFEASGHVVFFLLDADLVVLLAVDADVACGVASLELFFGNRFAIAKRAEEVLRFHCRYLS